MNRLVAFTLILLINTPLYAANDTFVTSRSLSMELANKLVMAAARQRSEERRVGKECRFRWSPDH